MMFSTRAEYGVRVMIQLGRRHGAGPVPLAEHRRGRGAAARLPRAARRAAAQGRAGRLDARRARRLRAGARARARSRWPRWCSALEGTLVPMQCFTEPGTEPRAVQPRDRRLRELRDEAAVDPRAGRRRPARSSRRRSPSWSSFAERGAAAGAGRRAARTPSAAPPRDRGRTSDDSEREGRNRLTWLTSRSRTCT